MRFFKPAMLLLSVALCAALVGHVTIDVLGDFMLPRDSYDNLDHSSRSIVALVTLALVTLGIGLGLRAAVREAHGSENAFCLTLGASVPRNVAAFSAAAAVLSTGLLGLMESCDAWLAGRAVDDVGDLLGGSVVFGLTIQAVVALVASLVAVTLLRRLARARIFAGAIVAFLRRRGPRGGTRTSKFEIRLGPISCVHYVCRRIAGRAPPLPVLIPKR